MSPWPTPLTLLLIPFLFTRVNADPATLPFADCFAASNSNIDQRISVDFVYAQVLPNEEWGQYLNLTILGSSPQEVSGFTNQSSSLATLFTSASILTLSAWSNSSYLCETLRPPSPLESLGLSKTFCPIAAGPLALSATIPLGSRRALTTLNTRIRAVDPFGIELFCIDTSTTPLEPQNGYPYGAAIIIFWSTVGLTMAYWLFVGVARIVSAWGRGFNRSGKGLWSRAQSAGFILASAISGERLATSPALMRFCTPSMRDIVFHTQWCAALAMVAVEWPDFVYPLLSQTAWSTLTYNVTLTPSGLQRWSPLSTLPYDPPTTFSNQLNDPTSPLFIDPDAPNVIFTLPPNTTSGLAAFAYTIGLKPTDLFSVCLILFLGIIAATVAISSVLWLVDYVVSVVCGAVGGDTQVKSSSNPLSRIAGTRMIGPQKDSRDPSTLFQLDEAKSPIVGAALYRPSSRATMPFSNHGSAVGSVSADRGLHSHRARWRLRWNANSFHGSVLQGNLARILVLFHLPVTIFSCYQMTLTSSEGGTNSGRILAALSFTFLSVLIPAHLVLRVRFTTTNKLYDETRTLLALGPLYNHYRHGSQMFASLLFATNIAFGVTIGAGQKSGTAQAIIILVVEVASALVTSIWLPWGSGASMGLISFLFCVARIVIAVLLVILTPAISIGPGAGGWVAYGILVILALVYLATCLMLAVKFLEALVRIFGGIGFDQSRNSVDSGLLGACGLLGCCGSRRRRHPRQNKYRQTDDNASHHTQQSSPIGSRAHPPFDGGYFPPGSATPPRFIGQDSRKGSTHSGPPPSVLRPEHALRPYREDSDDENGFIMSSWQHYHRVEPQPQVPKSGFSRVGGGKAHMDTPYSAIASSSIPNFRPPVHAPSLPRRGTGPAAFYHSGDLPSSLNSVGGRVEHATLPPAGPSGTFHVRTKSQSAIIENAAGIVFPTAGSSEPHQRAISNNATPIVIITNDDDDSGDDDSDEERQPKKKHWYQFGRKRVHSNGSTSGPPTPNLSSTFGTMIPAVGSSSNAELVSFSAGGENGEPAPSSGIGVGTATSGGSGAVNDPGSGSGGLQPAPQRSFVVIRKGQQASR